MTMDRVWRYYKVGEADVINRPVEFYVPGEMYEILACGESGQDAVDRYQAAMATGVNMRGDFTIRMFENATEGAWHRVSFETYRAAEVGQPLEVCR